MPELITDPIYTNWLGGRTLSFAGEMNGKASYSYGDETIAWNGMSFQWEMANLYDGVLQTSSEDTDYPWQVTTWSPDNSIYVERLAPTQTPSATPTPTPTPTPVQQNTHGLAPSVVSLVSNNHKSVDNYLRLKLLGQI